MAMEEVSKKGKEVHFKPSIQHGALKVCLFLAAPLWVTKQKQTEAVPLFLGVWVCLDMGRTPLLSGGLV